MHIGPWTLFIVVVVVSLAVDLGLVHRHGKEPTLRSAVGWSAFWIALSLTFNGWVWATMGAEAGQEFLTGYLLEKALSVDNLFVISVIFSYLRIPRAYQHRVLFWGILAAVVTRGVAIFAGVEILHRFEWMSLVLGGFLVYTGVKLLGPGEDEAEDFDNALVRWLKRTFPFTDEIHGEHFFVRIDGRLMATRLCLALAIVESTDVVFAVDSIPAVLGVTREPFIVYSSNVFAILGLRSLYFVLADAVVRFYYMKHGLAAILSFVGLKMLVAPLYHIPTELSLGFISVVLVASGLGSWVRHVMLERQRTERDEKRGHAHGTSTDLEMVKILHATPLFARTVLDDLREVAYDLFTYDLKPGEVVFTEGDAADGLYVVISGQVSIYRESDGQRIHLASLGPSESFGEVALFDDMPRTATVVADEDTMLLGLGKEAFQALGERRPAVLIEIIRVLSTRLRSANEALGAAGGGPPETAELPLIGGG